MIYALVAIDAGQTEQPQASAEAGNGQITLKWESEPNADHYNVFVGTEPGIYGAPVLVNGTSYAVVGLDNDRTYHAAVSAVSFKEAVSKQGSLSAFTKRTR